MAAVGKFQKLMAPLTLNNGVTLRNRVLMGSMHTGLEETKDNPYGKMAAFFAERAKGGTGLIVTGGVSPNFEGKVHPWACKMTSQDEATKYKQVTKAVHDNEGKILMQILHSGRYSYSPLAVAPSAIAAPIWPFRPLRPIGMPKFWVKKTVRDFARCAKLAQDAGFDGIELMCSEGYLINEFLAKKTNKRTDEYGGSYENRMRFLLEILGGIRKAVDDKFIIMTRISMLDLVDNGSTLEEVNQLAELVVAGGANIINTGIGWHEARIPTIATSVPRAAFTWVTKRTRDHLHSKGITNIPLVTTNRINSPDVGEKVIADEDADMVSMARPMLADAYFCQKATDGREKEINVCIGCNQACLDHVFKQKTSSCLVNPVACAELTLKVNRQRPAQGNYIVIGAGPAGCHAAITWAQQGQRVTLYEKEGRVGGQFHLARRVPGKEEYGSAITYWETMIMKYSKLIDLRLNAEFQPNQLAGLIAPPSGILVCSGCRPKAKDSTIMVGLEASPIVFNYLEVLTGRAKVGKRVAIIGCGGIGHDVAVYLTHARETKIEAFNKTWGIDTTGLVPGGLKKGEPVIGEREITMMQRGTGKVGGKLGATTGWIHRAALKHQKVTQIPGCTYESLNGNTLTYSIGEKKKTMEVDSVILCAGQKSNREIYYQLKSQLVKPVGTLPSFADVPIETVGGALLASELDAKRAIMEAHTATLRL